MEHWYCAENDKILLRPLAREDLEYLRSWRNDAELSVYLRDVPYITKESQIEWFENYLNDNTILFFAIVDKERKAVIGSAALYNFENNHCEVGKIVIGDASSHGKGIGYRSLLLAITLAIRKIGIKKFRLDVHENNIPARIIYDRIGFTVIGKHSFKKGGYELEMEITSNRFFEHNPEAKIIKVFMEDNMKQISAYKNGGGYCTQVNNGAITSRLRRCS